MVPSSSSYQGMWPDKDHVARWSAADKTIRTVLDARDQQKKDKRIDSLFERLEPLREEYWNTPAPRRAVFLALVVERLTRRIR